MEGVSRKERKSLRKIAFAIRPQIDSLYCGDGYDLAKELRKNSPYAVQIIAIIDELEDDYDPDAAGCPIRYPQVPDPKNTLITFAPRRALRPSRAWAGEERISHEIKDTYKHYGWTCPEVEFMEHRRVEPR